MAEKATEIVPASEAETAEIIAALEEENDLLASEVDRLSTVEPPPPEPQNLGPIARVLERLLGPLVYDGPHDCGHCKYWKAPRRLRDYRWQNGVQVWYDCKGDCKLLFGKKDTTKTGECHRFTPKRRYMRRVKVWRQEA
jgi:hypothetical protein